MQNPSDIKYKPGALWRARTEIMGINNADGEDVRIPYGSLVLLVEHKYSFFTEVAFVLLGDKKLFIQDIDFGLEFDMDPAKHFQNKTK